MFCPKCGKEISENNNFCPECGEKTEEMNNREVEPGEISKLATPFASFVTFLSNGIFAFVGYVLLRYFGNYAQFLMNTNVSKTTSFDLARHETFRIMFQNLRVQLSILLFLSISLIVIAILVLALKKKLQKNTLRIISIISCIFTIIWILVSCYPFFHS